MTNYFLEITLRSLLTSSTGEGRIGLVDRDVAFDDLGLPILPGRRLKGLWRDAYRDVSEAWRQCGQATTPAERIFGESGQGSGDRDACIYVANAELKEASSLKEWLEYLQHHKIRRLHSDDVVHHFATVRTQTAIDRGTGSAKENTLRLTRTLKSGLVFRARVHLVEPPDEALQNALALGAAALQHMGTARTRGIGKVHCRLIARDVNNQEHDLTEQVLQASNDDPLPTISIIRPNQSRQASKKRTAAPPNLNCTTPTHLLRYRLKLTSPVVIPVTDGDPNSVITRQDILGSHLWGAAAWHYLRQIGDVDDEFCHLFLDGNLRFLTAYPEARDPEDFGEPPQRTIPIPHSVREFKEKETLVDFVEPLDKDQKKEPKRRLSRRYAMIGESFLGTQDIKVERNYHHTRAGDRRKGRALGAEIPDGGAFFTYEAIQADQPFQGAVLGSEADLKNLQMWLPEGSLIRIGKSRSAQYGETEFEWIDKNPLELNNLVEWNGFFPHQPPQNRGEHLIVTTLSPLLAVNNYGHPEARFPEQELVKALGLENSTKTLTLSRSYTRTEFIGGYNAHLRLPRQQLPAIAAGSVFIFDTQNVQNHISEDLLLELERDGLGLRKGEGYGRIAVNRQNNLHLTNREEERLEDPEFPPVPNLPNTGMPEKVRDLLQGIVRTRCLADMQQDARDIANQATQENKIPSNALLGRLRLFLRQDSLVESLETLRGKRAEEQLLNYKINRRNFKMQLSNSLTLYDLFQTAGRTPNSLTRGLIEFWIEQLAGDCDENTRSAMVQTLVDNQSATLCRDFLDYLLTALRRKSST